MIYNRVGTKIKEFRGINIYLDREGMFYADALNNSSDYDKSTFKSAKLSSIESAITTFEEKVSGNEYYDIEPYRLIFKKLKVVSSVGKLLFFDDGTNSKNYNRNSLFPLEIENSDMFNILKQDFEKANEIELQIKKLQEEKRILLNTVSSNLNTFRKVEPTK